MESLGPGILGIGGMSSYRGSVSVRRQLTSLLLVLRGTCRLCFVHSSCLSVSIETLYSFRTQGSYNTSEFRSYNLSVPSNHCRATQLLIATHKSEHTTPITLGSALVTVPISTALYGPSPLDLVLYRAWRTLDKVSLLQYFRGATPLETSKKHTFHISRSGKM